MILQNRGLITATILSFAVNLVNYLDRAVIGSAAGQIISEFQLSDAQFGWLTSAFALGCIVSNCCSGFVLDRIGVKYVWASAIFCWSATMLGQAYVQSYPTFLIVRVLMGLAEGLNFPAMDRAHCDHWQGTAPASTTPPASSPAVRVEQHSFRSLTFGISLLGVFLAFVIGYPVFGVTIPTYGWRTTFIGLAILGCGTALLLLLVYQEQHDATKKHTSRGVHVWEETKLLLQDRTLLSVSWSFGVFGYVLTMAAVWLPNYLKSAHSINLRGISIIAMGPFALASVLVIVVAVLSDYLHIKYSNDKNVTENEHNNDNDNDENTKKNRKQMRISQIYPIALCQFLSLISFVPLLITSPNNATAATVCTILGIGIGLANNAPYYTFCATRFPAYASQATGIIVTFFSIGSVLSPFVTGYIIEHANFAAAFGVVVGLLASSIIALLGFAFPDQAPEKLPAPNDDDNNNNDNDESNEDGNRCHSIETITERPTIPDTGKVDDVPLQASC